MIFKNRQEAGQKLAPLLLKYRGDKNVIILALPRGGVVTGYEVAKVLGAPLDVICPRKIGAPFNPELAVGAITETGQGIFNLPPIEQLGIDQNYLDQAIAIEKEQARRRLKLFRKDLPPRNLAGKTVILIDDGLATGSTMRAAIQSVKHENAAKIIVAVPTAPKHTVQEIQKEVDEVVCLDMPPFFQAIGQFYEEFTQVEDETVLELLHKPTV